jgi:FtsP/CotA-like multicopper oxidase with cupredoxin domain
MFKDVLFSSLRLGVMQLPNRIVNGLLTRIRAGVANVPTALNAEYAQRSSAGLNHSDFLAKLEDLTSMPAGPTGLPPWPDFLARLGGPKPFQWSYAQFGNPGAAVPKPDQIFDMTFAKQNAAEGGSIDGRLTVSRLPKMRCTPTLRLNQGKRYRLRMRNASDDIHPVHLHRHSFELTRVAGQPTSGVIKDVVMVGGYQEMEIDFVADNPGLTLFHCHQQLHMDFGFMALFEYV